MSSILNDQSSVEFRQVPSTPTKTSLPFDLEHVQLDSLDLGVLRELCIERGLHTPEHTNPQMKTCIRLLNTWRATNKTDAKSRQNVNRTSTSSLVMSTVSFYSFL